MNVWMFITFVLLVVVHTAWANIKNEEDLENANILKNFLARYDKRIMPAIYGPVYVYVGIDVSSLIELDAEKNLYRIVLSFHQKWHDERFQFLIPYFKKLRQDFFLRPNLDNIWIPDLLLQDAMEFPHRTLMPSTEVRIYPSDGQVHCSSRISIDVYWPMDLTNFPMDKPVFEMEIVTHGHAAKDIAIHWLSRRYQKHREAIRISKMFHFPPFSVSSMGAYPCTGKTNTSEDSCKKMMIYFTRDFTHYLLRAFIPTISLVIFSWIPFWLHPHSMTTRLSIVTMLLVIFVVLAVTESGPRVFYLKAMDVWMGSCFCFIFCALIEIVIANRSISTDKVRNKKLSTKDVLELCVNGTARTDSCLPPKYTSLPPHKPSMLKHYTQEQKIDVISRFLFPIAFSIFNLVFWLFYTAK